MPPAHVYGAFTGELGVGALRFAGSPFPLSPVARDPLPRWIFRAGYTHAVIGGTQADGYVSSLRFVW